MINYTDSLVIDFSRQDDILYWSNKWEISPTHLFIAFVRTNSNRISELSSWLRNCGFAL